MNMTEQYMISMTDVMEAEKILRNVVKNTPLEHSRIFSEITGSDVYLKLENLQTTGSFKIRGAYNKIYHLSQEEKKNGVVAASAGNHSQGVAYAAKTLNTKAVIFMPIFTPPIKVIATKYYGAEVQLYGYSYDDAYKKAIEYAEKHKMSYIHAFNDPYIIAGQATIGLEIFESLKDVEAVIVPIGGGGLISGISFALKSLNSKIKIIGVEAEGAPSMKQSLEKGEIVPLKTADTIADGIAVKIPGPLTFEMTRIYVDDVVTVTDDEIAYAMYMLLTRNKLVAEPAGAASLAALLSGKVNLKGKKVVSIISGGNVDYTLLSQIIFKGLMTEKLLFKIKVKILDKPGQLKKILEFLSQKQINVIDIETDRISQKLNAGSVYITLTIQAVGQENLTAIEEFMKQENIEYTLDF